METVTLQERYGSLKAGTECRVIEDGMDYVKVRYQGKGVYIPVKMVQASRKRRFAENLPTYEDILSEEEV